MKNYILFFWFVSIVAPPKPLTMYQMVDNCSELLLKDPEHKELSKEELKERLSKDSLLIYINLDHLVRRLIGNIFVVHYRKDVYQIIEDKFQSLKQDIQLENSSALNDFCLNKIEELERSFSQRLKITIDVLKACEIQELQKEFKKRIQELEDNFSQKMNDFQVVNEQAFKKTTQNLEKQIKDMKVSFITCKIQELKEEFQKQIEDMKVSFISRKGFDKINRDLKSTIQSNDEINRTRFDSLEELKSKFDQLNNRLNDQSNQISNYETIVLNLQKTVDFLSADREIVQFNREYVESLNAQFNSFEERMIL